VHYTERAAVLPLQPGKKLVLMCVADSANADNRVGFPGFDALLQWSGLGRSAVYKVLDQLVAEGWLARHGAGGRGKRAEFVVFPHGDCCPMHGPLSGYAERRPGDDAAGSTPVDPGTGDAQEAPACAQSPVETVDSNPKAELQGPLMGPPQSGPLPSSVLGTTSRGTLTGVGAEPAVDSPPSTPPPAAAAPPPAVEDPEPAEHCWAWPHPDRPCPPCGDARRAHTAWADRQLARRRAVEDVERHARQQALLDARLEAHACGLCDPEGVAHVDVSGAREPVVCWHDAEANQRSVLARLQARTGWRDAPPQDPPAA